MDITKRPFVLLPQDRVIMEITGMDREQYRDFCLQCYMAGRSIPSTDPVAFDPFTAVAYLIIGIALSFAASLLAPKPRVEEITPQREEGGQNFVNGRKSAPTSGFDSVQNVVEVGSVISIVYANRREINGIWYGGVRVNTNLLWSQLYSIGGGQLLRALFSVSEGNVPTPDPEQFAIGNNIIRNFDLAKNDVSRVSLYYVNGSDANNRIVSTDHIAGRNADSDLGNAENDGGTNVFQARTATGWADDFCSVVVPSNQTSLGLSGFIGNNMPFRPNPRIKPTENYDNEPQKPDPQGKTERAHDVWKYYGRCGVNKLNGNPTTDEFINLVPGDQITYSLFSDSDNDGVFQYQISAKDGFSYTNDIADSVASRQSSYDDQIVLGDKYLIGNAIGVCVSRTNQPFVSEVDNTPVGGGQTVTAVFEITEPGGIHAYDSQGLHPALGPYDDYNKFVGNNYPAYGPRVNATLTSHIFRLTEASFTTERSTRYIEVGLKSRVNLQINGICYFRGIAYDDEARTLSKIDSERVIDNIVFTNGNFTSPEARYSGFRVKFRSTSTAAYSVVPMIFLVRSQQSTDVFNYLRFEMDTSNTWEFQLTPASSWEIRNGTDDLHVLDYKRNNRVTVSTLLGMNIVFTGLANIARNADNFAIPPLTTIDGTELDDNNGPDLSFDDLVDGRGYYGDAFARIAEGFMFEEMTTTANQPEHSIVYVNVQTTNSQIPRYDNIAMVGMNLRSSTEIRELQQFSVYVNQGINSTNLFPEVLLDMFTNTRYGLGNVLNTAQIDTASFAAMATWCENRKYFFDGVIDSKLNIRDWGTITANNYLLDLIVRNGQFALQPVADFDTKPVITALFTSGNILDNTFEFTSADEQDRIRPRVSVKWREEKLDTNNGLFPVVRQVTVRESDTAEDAPLETLDISAYATSQKQAIDLAKWTCRRRRYITHSIKFETTPTQAALDIGAVFNLGMETIAYDQPQNGAIAADGTVTSWPPLSNGTYDALTWTGTATTVEERTIKIENGKAVGIQNAVFCIKSGIQSVETYKTQALNYTEDGNINVEATVYPCDKDGASLLTMGWDDPSNWSIEGQRT